LAGSDYYGEMFPIKCRGLLFDLDGVLVDSTPAVARVWAGWAHEHGFDPDEVVKKAHGRPSITTIRELLPHADHAAEDREVERREIADVEGVIPLPGAMELLQVLPLERWAIVTSCTRALAQVRIAAAGLPKPKHLVTSTDVKNGKPAPEPYLKGAQMLSVAAGECIVIEDAPAGIRARAKPRERASWHCALPQATLNSGKPVRIGLSMTVRKFFWIPPLLTKSFWSWAVEHNSPRFRRNR
jgi:sugar-phosphatase